MYKESSHYAHFETLKKIVLCKSWVYGTELIIQLMQISPLPPKVLVEIAYVGDSFYVMPKLYAIQIQMSTLNGI